VLCTPKANGLLYSITTTMAAISRPRLLLIASLVLLTATGYIVGAYGQSAYFVAFHKPFHLSLAHTTKKYTPPVLPKFRVQPAISSRSLARGDTQRITVTLSSDKAAVGYLEVWIESPAHRQVFRTPSDSTPIQFPAGKTQTFLYTYMLPKNLPSGTYSVSAIVTSANQQTDYYVNNNFATFTLS